MDLSFENPAVRYGMSLSTVVILVVLAFGFLEGTIRWLVLGIAVVELVFVLQLLKLAAEQDNA